MQIKNVRYVIFVGARFGIQNRKQGHNISHPSVVKVGRRISASTKKGQSDFNKGFNKNQPRPWFWSVLPPMVEK